MKVKGSSVFLGYKTCLAGIVAICILLLDLWAVAGVFNDQVTLFKYMNYFGYYIPVLAILMAAAAMFFISGWLLRSLVICLTFPAVLIPVILASLPFSGSSWELGESIDGTEISIISYSKMSRNRDYKRLSELLDCSKVDIILMQEASDFEDLLEAEPEIADYCNYAFTGGDYKSLVLLTRLPILSSVAHRTHNTFSIDVSGRPVTLITTRVDKSLKPQGGELQRKQISEIIEDLPDPDNVPVILAGDFNSTPHNATIYRMKEAMAYAAPEGLMFSTFTFPAEGRWYASLGALIRIDHIFYRGLSLHSSRVLDDSYGSDHYPVRAVFTVPDTMESTNE